MYVYKWFEKSSKTFELANSSLSVISNMLFTNIEAFKLLWPPIKFY